MTQKGKVIAVSGDMATVLVMRQSACEGCRQKNLCGGMGECSHEKPLETTAQNPAGAKVGDTVELTASSGFVLGTAFLIFILPILCAIVCYGVMFTQSVDRKITYGATAAAFLLPLALSLYGMNRHVQEKKCVVITRIETGENQISEN